VGEGRVRHWAHIAAGAFSGYIAHDDPQTSAMMVGLFMGYQGFQEFYKKTDSYLDVFEFVVAYYIAYIIKFIWRCYHG